MSQFFISCKESKIENNRSFYGCFHLGPFEPSQSITIANALRRTLLSELYGLSIVSVEIEGATHEYSNLNGVKDSILDILLNLKEIVFKKTINPIGIKPQIGYLKARGPGLVRASNLRLPPFIQCVDPDQYIATLADDGFLNMKFIIQYSNKWLSNQNSNIHNQNKDVIGKEEIKTQKNIYNYNSSFNLHLKKRRLILKKLKQIGFKSSNLYINMFSYSLYPSIYNENSLNNKNNIENISKLLLLPANKSSSPWMSYLQVPAVKLFKTKKNGNSILEKTVSALGQTDPEEEADIKKKRKILLAINNLNKKNSKKVSSPAINLRQKIKNRIVTLPVSSLPLKDSEMKKSVSNKKNRTIKDKILSKFKTNSLGKNTNYSFNNFSPFFNSSPLTIDAIFNPITKVNYIIEVNDYKTTQTSFETSFETLELFEILNMTKTETRLIDFAPSERIDTRIRSDNSASNNLKSLNLNTFGSTGSVVNKNSNFLENILQIKREITILKKEIPKHNIIFEVWTNGSIHPRDAIYQGFKNLVKLFSKLNKINAFMINPLILNSLQYNNNVPNSTNGNKQIKKDFFFKKIKQNEISPTFSDQTLSTLSSDLLPLNETSFLSTYMAPKIKNYYPALPARWAERADKNSDNLSTKKAFPALASSPCDNSMGGHASSSRKRIRKEFAGETYISGTQLEYKNNSIRDSKDSLPGSNSLEKLNKKLILENLDLSILNLSLRSYTYLKRLNINTVEEVRLFLKNKSSNLKKLSKVCLEEIERSLEIIGF